VKFIRELLKLKESFGKNGTVSRRLSIFSEVEDTMAQLRNEKQDTSKCVDVTTTDLKAFFGLKFL